MRSIHLYHLPLTPCNTTHSQAPPLQPPRDQLRLRDYVLHQTTRRARTHGKPGEADAASTTASLLRDGLASRADRLRFPRLFQRQRPLEHREGRVLGFAPARGTHFRGPAGLPRLSALTRQPAPAASTWRSSPSHRASPRPGPGCRSPHERLTSADLIRIGDDNSERFSGIVHVPDVDRLKDYALSEVREKQVRPLLQ